MQEQVAKKLYSIYYDTVLTLLIMYKGTCSEEEWSEISERRADLECFTDDFYEKMATLDIKSCAYTMLQHKDDCSPLNWCEYLSDEAKRLFAELNKVFLQYHAYLNEDLLRILDDLMTSTYLEMFSGELRLKGMETTSEEDGLIYFDSIPLLAIYQQSNTIQSTIFSEKQILEEYISLLTQLYHQLKKMPRTFTLQKDGAIKN